jgi:hypothetical protein
MKNRILPEQFHILSGSALKAIAVAAMVIDHVGICLESRPVPLFTAFGQQITLYLVMRFIGRLAFPIFAFLIVEGYRHTRNRIRYGASLLLFAFLSEIPWDLFNSGMWFSFDKQNVFFTLFLGYLGIFAYEYFRGRRFLRVFAIVLLLAASLFLQADYGLGGFCFLLLVYALRDYELLRDAVGVAVLPSKLEAGLAFFPLALYNEKRGFIKGPVLKYAFYFFYPLHLLILYFIRIRYLG